MVVSDGNTQAAMDADSALPPHNLPRPPTSLVGREHEITAASYLLQREEVRLLTLTGPPGIGKTRLAIEVANVVLADFEHGVYFIDLSPIGDANLVLTTVAHTLGIGQVTDSRLINALKAFLMGRRVLLVLDNFEQVLQTAPALTELLQTALPLKILVTSRELLRVSGEQHFPVPPLSLPPVLTDRDALRALTCVSPERLSDYEAVRLFVQRATALQPDFALTSDNALSVAGICCKLDGLPLAIELAAARIRHLPTQTIYEKLEKGLQVLTGGARDLPQRQRTLRNSIAWSYNLLDDGERVLLARLAVFRGGCSLLAVEAVCEGLSIDVLDGLASLVDKSLVQKKETPQGEARFVMLELILEYAREQLEASGEAESIRRHHARYFVALAERAEMELRLPYQKYWFHLLEMEIDNLRSALEWALGGGDITLGIRIASGTFLYWYLCGRQDEGIRWTQHLLNQINEAEPAHQIRLLRSAARLNMYRDRGTALRLSRQALAIARDYGDKRQLAWALCTMDTVLVGNPKEKAVSQEALALFRELDDLQGIARVVNNIGEHARVIGDDQRAKRAYQESLILAERMGDTVLQYTVLVNNAFIAQHEGNHREAIRLLRRSLALSQDIGVPADVARILLTLAGSLGALGRPRRAAHLFGAASAYLERRGALIDPNDLPELDRNMAFVRAQLGEAAFEQAWAEGQALTLEQAVAHATSDSDALLIPRCGPDKESQPPGGLTRRELEVALLVAEGKSNREIAAAFVIAERTVEGHVSNILSKLGFRSRTQVSIWVIENKLSGR